jgi:hypothetical protein
MASSSSATPLRLAAREEFDGRPPEPVQECLERNGVEL